MCGTFATSFLPGILRLYSFLYLISTFEAESREIFGYVSLLNWTVSENTAKNHEIFVLQDGGRQDIVTCVV